MLWNLCWLLLYRTSARPLHAWRSLLLRLFGAKMGPRCHFYPGAKVWAPWNLICADQVTAGDGVEIYNPSPVTCGSHVIFSQGSYICGATHDYDDPAFPLLAYRMSFGAYAWICARACVAPGVNVGEGAVLGLGSVATPRPRPLDGLRGCACRRHPPPQTFQPWPLTPNHLSLITYHLSLITMISVLILTRNEAQNLPACLASVAWSDDIHVLDSLSTDGTQDLATAAGARVTERAFDDWSSHQNWALQNLPFKHPWVFYLDADERVTPELRNSLLQAAANPGDACAFRVRRRDFFMDTWLKHVQTSPFYLRLFRPQTMRYERLVNPVSIPAALWGRSWISRPLPLQQGPGPLGGAAQPVQPSGGATDRRQSRGAGRIQPARRDL